MGMSLAIDLFAKVFIVRNQYPVLGKCFLKKRLIIHPARLVIHRKYLISLRAQPLRYSRTGTFIHHEAHLLF